MNDLVEKSDGIRIRLEIEENFSSFSINNLQKFMNMFSTKSIVILFMSKRRESLLLFWKSKDIDYLLTFKPPEKKTAFEIKELYGFIACSLVSSLSCGHLGMCILKFLNLGSVTLLLTSQIDCLVCVSRRYAQWLKSH